GAEDRRRIVPDATSPVIQSPNRLLFFRQGSVFAGKLDPGRFALQGEPVRISEQVAGFSSASEVLAIRRTGHTAQQLTWLDRAGRQLGAVGAGDTNALSVELSPDDSRVAIHRVDDVGNMDIWVIDARRNVMTRLTSDPANDQYPVWSPDGTRLVFG